MVTSSLVNIENVSRCVQTWKSGGLGGSVRHLFPAALFWQERAGLSLMGVCVSRPCPRDGRVVFHTFSQLTVSKFPAINRQACHLHIMKHNLMNSHPLKQPFPGCCGAGKGMYVSGRLSVQRQFHRERITILLLVSTVCFFFESAFANLRLLEHWLYQVVTIDPGWLPKLN